MIARSDEWVFEPEAEYERFGDVDKVVFPCGWIEQNGEVRIYYGASDGVTCVADLSLASILQGLG